ncbi:uncharacterized protein ACLA_051440 [Aspergillus clavatus NRRL 1]|uniref:Conserved lysine-rich protein, putative n=1 Tax=Aspergillus clavatus (strain ATCC 1007 / CBS 513.65 / DSM 816 / NCTC 3887 / NRRL 1 / QM 1276 / 107) TaxID=344612 RepID=A1CIG7_ASPCL|nr:conserved lysine-rich protein, putative [Aspergillus clavatus NRRL 1]EAW10672.1 conserved lysine-rich protein, putative [Aspergillus clavatus NRRL 1]
MSEVQKTVEEIPAAVPAVAPVAEAPVATEAPATEAPVVAEAPKETPVESTEAAPAVTEATTEAATEQPKEEAKEETKEEIAPATEGVLGHKGHGLVKGLRFSKRFFYFSDEAVEAKQLSVFQQNEKPAVAHPIVAWATQTGKGLLFLTKRAEDKATPAGIFNLAEVSDITKEGSNEFHFKVNGQKHTFQAANAAERDSWIVALEAKAAEAKVEKDVITASEGYKAELEKLTKPVVPEVAKKPVEAKEEPKKEEVAAVEEPKETKEVKDKAHAKSRSQSRKRASIFGSLLGKKEETEEKKEEEKVEEAKPAEAVAEPTPEAAVEAPVATEVVEAAAPVEAAGTKEETEQKKEEKEEKKAESPAPRSKRSSLFGNFFQKVTSPSHEKSEKEVVAAPVETAAVSSTAPQLDNPVEEAAVKPIEPEAVTAAADVEAPKDTAAAAQPAVVETPSAVKDKRRTSFFGNFGKKKGDSDNEDVEAKHKGNKLGGLFRKPSKAVKLDNKEAPATKDTEEKTEAATQEVPAEAPVEETPKPAGAPATEEAKPVTVTSTSTPVQAAA